MEQRAIVLGLMSGSSLDGLDLALARFTETREGWQYDLLGQETVAYENTLRERLASAYQAPLAEILDLDVYLGRFFGQCSLDFISRHKTKPGLIASHGHTLFHQPALGYTQQLGHPTHIAAATGLAVAADFRSMDVALGGQGAPLVPLGDRLLFPQHAVCLNLGGIANLSFEEQGKRVAWDVACCNMVFDRLAQQTGKNYDDEGKIATSGQVSATLVAGLNALSYYQLPPPKSLGREYFESHVWPLLEKSDLSVPDKMASYARHLSDQLKNILLQHGLKGSMLVTGGGAFNRHLIRMFRVELPVSVEVPEPALINQKEALIFAFLGHLRQLGRINVLSSVTGSRCDHVGGHLYFPPAC